MKRTVSFLLLCLSILLFQSYLLGGSSEVSKWVRDRTKDLNSKGSTVQTSFGPIQYVWKGNKNKPVLVCLHGAFGGYDQSLLIGQYYLHHNFSILAISRPGYLGSTFRSTSIISNEDQATAIKEVLDALGIAKAGVIGFSAGAPVAFQLANQYPEKIFALVLESIGAFESDIDFYLFLSSLLDYEKMTRDIETLDFTMCMLYQMANADSYSTAQKVLTMDSHLSQEALNRRITFVTNHTSQSKFLRKLIGSLTPLSPRLDGTENDFVLANLGNWPKDPSFYKNLNTPTIMIQSIHDTDGNFSLAEYVHRQISSSEFLPIDGCGHFIWLGNTSSWEKHVDLFLKTYLPK